MSKAWLGLGANIGNPPAQLKQAIEYLGKNDNIEIIATSSILVNPPWGKTDQALFHNLVVEVATSLAPNELLEICLDIEQQMGRIRGEKWGPRLIDIDIIAYDRLQQKTKHLTLPHPYAHERNFVISPLREISAPTANWILDQAEA